MVQRRWGVDRTHCLQILGRETRAIYPCQDGSDAETVRFEDWGDGSLIVFWSERFQYLQCTASRKLRANFVREPSFLRLMMSEDVRCLCCLGDPEDGPKINRPEEGIGSFEIRCAKNVSIEYRSLGLMICRYRV